MAESSRLTQGSSPCSHRGKASHTKQGIRKMSNEIATLTKNNRMKDYVQTNDKKFERIEFEEQEMIVAQQEQSIKQKYENAIAWIDIETTGTNPQSDKILQIAVIVTNNKFEIIEQHEWVIKHDMNEAYNKANKYVQEMHLQTNLWVRLETEGIELQEADIKMTRILTNLYNGYKINIGGNSVHFDNAFIQAQMPLTANLVSHRVLDISAVLQYFRVTGNKVTLPKHEVSHDAMDDILWTITQAKAIQQHINNTKEQGE